jgi:hypothetical protein
MQKGRSKKLGQQQEKESLNGGSQDSSRIKPEKMVQGRLERCPIREALRQTKGRKARNTLLQTIKACKLKDPKDCI